MEGSDAVSSCRRSFNSLVLQSAARNRKKNRDALLHSLKYELGVCMFSPPLSVPGDQGRSPLKQSAGCW